MTTDKPHTYLRLTILTLAMMVTSTVLGQENKVPLKPIGSWPENNLWGTKPQNALDQNPSTSWSVQSDNLLMLEYLRVKDIDNTKDGKRSWIEIQYTPNANTEIEIVFENKTTVDQYHRQYLFGADTPQWGGGYSFALENGNYAYWASKRKWETNDNSADTGNKHTAICTLNNIKLDGVDHPTTTEDSPYSYSQGVNHLYFFSAPHYDQNWAYTYDGKIYSVKIRENETLLYDLVPAKNGTDQWARCGFYDKLTGNMYYFFEMLDFVENNDMGSADSAPNYLHFKVPYTYSAATVTQRDIDLWSANLVQNPTSEAADLSGLTSFSVEGTNVVGSVVQDGSEYIIKVVSPPGGAESKADINKMVISLTEPLLPGDEYYVSFSYKCNHTVDAIYVGAHTNTQWNDKFLDPLPNCSTNEQWFDGVWSGVITPKQGKLGGMTKIVFSLNNLPTESYDCDYYFKNIVIRKKAGSANLVKNGYFSTSDESSFDVQGEGVTKSIVDGNLKISTTSKAGTESHASQLIIKLDETLQEGKRYYISFAYKASTAREVSCQVQNNATFNSGLPDGILNFSGTNWQTKEWTGIVSADMAKNGGMNCIALNLHKENEANDFLFDEVVVRRMPDILDPDIEMEVRFQNTYTLNDSYSNRYVFAFGETNPVMSLNVKPGTSRYNFTSGAVQYLSDIAGNVEAEHTVVVRPGECEMDGKLYLADGIPDWTSIQHLYLMGAHSASDQYFRSMQGKLYGAKIREKQSDRTVKVVKDLCPARNADGEWGLWDKVGKSFYGKCTETHAADGAFFGGAVTDNADGIPVATQFSLTTTTESGQPILPKRFMITTVSHEGSMLTNTANNPKSWKLLASNDGETWTQLKLGINRPVYSAPATGGATTQYLYNIGTGTFLKGGLYGTRGAVGTHDQSDEGTAQQFRINYSDWTGNLVNNGDLTTDIKTAFGTKNGASITIDTENKELKVNCPQNSEKADYYTLSIAMTETLQAGDLFEVSFEYKSDFESEVQSRAYHDNNKNSDNPLNPKPKFTTGWQTRTWTGMVSADMGKNGGWNKLLFNINTHPEDDNNFYFKNIQIKRKQPTDELINYVGDEWKNAYVFDNGKVWLDRSTTSPQAYQINYNNWIILPGQGAENVCEIMNAGYPNCKLGVKSDVLNGISDQDVYLSENALYTKWAFVSESDYNTYTGKLSPKTYDAPDMSTPFTNATTHWFTILDNLEKYKMYRLEVASIGWGSTLSLADVAITADYDFEHYVGRVYDGKTSDDESLPADLRWGSKSTYKSVYKNSNDDARLASTATIQRTHEYTHEIYLLPGSSVSLTPFEDFKTASQYREKYVRWYRYSDMGATPAGDVLSPKLHFEPQNGKNVLVLANGYFSGNQLLPELNNENELLIPGNRQVGTVAEYRADNSRETEDILDVIACEASNSFAITGVDGDSHIKEPTLTWRHLFVIKNAAKRRDQMVGAAGASASESKTANENYIDTHRLKLMCPEGTPFQYPLPYHEFTTKNSSNTNPTDFLAKGNKIVYHYRIETWKNDTGGVPVLLGSTRIKYNMDASDKGVIIYKNASDVDLTPEEKKHAAFSFKEINGFNRVFYIEDPQTGTYTIKLFAQDQYDRDIDVMGKTKDDAGFESNSLMQLMEYELTVLPQSKASMVTEEELTTDTYKHQSPESLVKAYGKATTTVNFDNIKEADKRKNGSGDSYYIWPIKWENSSYGFGYNNRDDYNMYMLADHNRITGFTHYDVYDRKYIESNKTGERGHFLHANAASDPGRMVSLNIGRNFCPNTTIYVSAWMCELQEKDKFAETANIVFSFIGVKADGSETILNSYVSGYIPGGWNTPKGLKPYDRNKDAPTHVDAINNPDHRGEWMHVYYSFQADVAAARAAEFDHYIITLENNCTSSQGADYAIDDIRAFVCRPQINARQTVPICNGEISTAIELFGDFDKFVTAFSLEEGTNKDETFCYSFLDYTTYEAKMLEAYNNLESSIKTTYPTIEEWRLSTDPSRNTAYQAAYNASLIRGSYGGSSTDTYGTITINTTFENNEGYEIIGDRRNLNFNASATDANIKVGKKYIITLMKSADDRNLSANPPTYSDFEVEGACAQAGLLEVVANYGEVKIDGQLSSDLQDLNFCANEKPMVTINLNGIAKGGEPVEYSSAYFDWYLGPLAHLDGYTAYSEVDDGKGQDLADAMEMLRLKYPTAIQADVMDTSGSPVTATGSDPSSDFTQAMLELIKSQVTAGKLILHELTEPLSTADQYNESKKSKFYITAIPINPAPSENIKFCLTPLQISVNLNPRAPSLQDGHHIIGYPGEMKDVPLRIGLKQLKRTTISSLNHDWVANAATDKLLRIPLRNVQPSKNVHGVPLSTELKKLEVTNAEGIRRADDDLVYLISSTDPDVTGGIDIYDYKLTDAMYDEFISDLKVIGRLKNIVANPTSASENICYIAFLDNFKFREGYEYTIKFHFEDYVGHKPINACPGDAVFTIKVVPEYQMWTGAVSRNWNDDRNWKRVTREELLNPSESNVSGDFVVGTSNGNTASFVPADFTKVIIPADCERVPYMYDMYVSGNTIDVQFAGSPANGKSWHQPSTPIKHINLASPEQNWGGYLCQNIIGAPSDKISYNMASIDVTEDGDVACRPWYDHTCDQIHFMAGAELMDQRYLYYNKAWADIDVPVGTWQTVASPLTNIVAGDLYLPTASARQETPLFEDITYSTLLNDRFKPAVFQRSWNASMAKVYQLDGTSLSDRNVGIKLDWSKVYNDVNVQYGAGTGFAIKVDVSAMDADPKPATAMFRLPKADLSYTYYNPGNDDGSYKTEPVNSGDIVNGVRPGRLADLTSTFQQVVGDGATEATATSYFLVGNPLMCWLDMEAFFTENTQFEKKYWIVSDQGQRAALFSETDGWTTTLSGNPRYIAPGKSFFVKSTSTGKTQQPRFTAAMMSYTQGEAPTSPGRTRAAEEESQKAQLLITAASNGRESKAIIKESEFSFVPTLFDTNLRDDILVHTIASGQAQTIASTAECDTLPLVVSGAQGEATLHIERVGTMSAPLYLVDTEEGTTTELTADVTLPQTTNGVRYYIITQRNDMQEQITPAASLPRVTAHHGRITIYAPSDGTITDAHIFNSNGNIEYQSHNITASDSATLPSGIYIIKLKANGHTYTYKIMLD